MRNNNIEKLKAPTPCFIERIFFIGNSFDKNKVLTVYPQLNNTPFTALFEDITFRQFYFYLRKHLKYLQLHVVE
jgi:hypothetical protein